MKIKTTESKFPIKGIKFSSKQSSVKNNCLTMFLIAITTALPISEMVCFAELSKTLPVKKLSVFSERIV